MAELLVKPQPTMTEIDPILENSPSSTQAPIRMKTCRTLFSAQLTISLEKTRAIKSNSTIASKNPSLSRPVSVSNSTNGSINTAQSSRRRQKTHFMRGNTFFVDNSIRNARQFLEGSIRISFERSSQSIAEFSCQTMTFSNRNRISLMSSHPRIKFAIASWSLNSSETTFPQIKQKCSKTKSSNL